MRVRFSLDCTLAPYRSRIKHEDKPTVEISHSRMDLSSDPEASVLESGLQAIVDIPARCPSRMCNCLPLGVSHILIVASAAKDAPDQLRESFQRGVAYSNSQCIGRRAKTSQLPHPFCGLLGPTSLCIGYKHFSSLVEILGAACVVTLLGKIYLEGTFELCLCHRDRTCELYDQAHRDFLPLTSKWYSSFS